MDMNWHQKHKERLSFSEIVADRLANFIGSWKFIIIQSAIFVVWVIVNTLYVFSVIVWDPYPFILFNLFMSAEAAYSAPLILMSQNRQALLDRVHAEEDYQTNLIAKAEIEALQIFLERIEVEKLSALHDRAIELDVKLDLILSQLNECKVV